MSAGSIRPRRSTTTERRDPDVRVADAGSALNYNCNSRLWYLGTGTRIGIRAPGMRGPFGEMVPPPLPTNGVAGSLVQGRSPQRARPAFRETVCQSRYQVPGRCCTIRVACMLGAGAAVRRCARRRACRAGSCDSSPRSGGTPPSLAPQTGAR